MVKKKKEKYLKKKNFDYRAELIGLLLILIAIIGLGDFGPIGNIISGFAIFIAGTCYGIVLGLIFITGLYMIVKRKSPEFFTSKLVGFYILLLAFLILAHINFVKLNNNSTEMLKETIDQLLLSFKGSVTTVDTGGGIIGALLALLFAKMFTVSGAYVVIIALITFGFVMLFNVPLVTIFKWFSNLIKKLFKNTKIDKESIKKAEQQYEEDNKIIISNIDELTKIDDNKQINKEEIIEDNNIDNSAFNEYILPPLTLLKLPKHDTGNSNQGIIKANIGILERVLNDFDINGKVVEVHVGPSVTQYEIDLKAGTKVNRVLSINREIALALAARTVRIQAPIPGKNTIGIEIPNKVNSLVSLREILSNVPINIFKMSKLLVALGKDIMGKPVYAEINKMPHLLIAGATGSGKSVCINGIITSILMRTKPDEVKLLLIDPKKVELSIYNGVPHLLAPVVTNPKKASLALMKIVSEMERRYDMFDDNGTKNIAGYNKYIENKNKILSDDEKMKELPYIVVIIDELADLMLIASKEVEDAIMRITQMARAAGIHLIVATQRPSTDVITGIIKANIPSRISFSVSSNVDSRTILDMPGAEKLLGKGDMLFLPMEENVPIRIQGTYISEEEVKKVVEFTINQQEAKYDEKLMDLENKESNSKNEVSDDEDPLYDEIVDFAIRNEKISASLIQRKFRLGYNRAARIIDLMEERGLVGTSKGSKPRDVLVKFKDDNNEEESEEEDN